MADRGAFEVLYFPSIVISVHQLAFCAQFSLFLLAQLSEWLQVDLWSFCSYFGLLSRSLGRHHWLLWGFHKTEHARTWPLWQHGLPSLPLPRGCGKCARPHSCVWPSQGVSLEVPWWTLDERSSSFLYVSLIVGGDDGLGESCCTCPYLQGSLGYRYFYLQSWNVCCDPTVSLMTRLSNSRVSKTTLVFEERFWPIHDHLLFIGP